MTDDFDYTKHNPRGEITGLKDDFKEYRQHISSRVDNVEKEVTKIHSDNRAELSKQNEKLTEISGKIEVLTERLIGKDIIMENALTKSEGKTKDAFHSVIDAHTKDERLEFEKMEGRFNCKISDIHKKIEDFENKIEDQFKKIGDKIAELKSDGRMMTLKLSLIITAIMAVFSVGSFMAPYFIGYITSPSVSAPANPGLTPPSKNP